jgi:hypothetical protein
MLSRPCPGGVKTIDVAGPLDAGLFGRHGDNAAHTGIDAVTHSPSDRLPRRRAGGYEPPRFTYACNNSMYMANICAEAVPTSLRLGWALSGASCRASSRFDSRTSVSRPSCGVAKGGPGVYRARRGFTFAHPCACEGFRFSPCRGLILHTPHGANLNGIDPPSTRAACHPPPRP